GGPQAGAAVAAAVRRAVGDGGAPRLPAAARGAGARRRARRLRPAELHAPPGAARRLGARPRGNGAAAARDGPRRLRGGGAMRAAVRLTFAPALLPLLPSERRRGPVSVPCDGSSTLGHLIESAGVPLTEVGGLVVDGRDAPVSLV